MTEQDPPGAQGEPWKEQPAERAGEPPADAGGGQASSRRYQPVPPPPPAPPPAPRHAYWPAQPTREGGAQPSTPQPARGPAAPGSQQPGRQQLGRGQPTPLRQADAWQWQRPGALPAGPQPQWSWARSLLGVLVGFVPVALLSLAAYATGTATGGAPEQVTLGAGIVFLVSSAVFYGWQLFAVWMFSLRGVAHALWHLGYRRPTTAYFWAVPLVLAVSYIVIVANETLLHPPPQDLTETFPHTAAGIVMFTLLAVVMAPLAEETFFRGFIYRGFAQSWGFLPGATISGAIFSLAHLQLTLFIPLFVLGFGLAWAYNRTGSLWTNITIHAIFNGISVLVWALS
jgi:membrane protease YdiL (CAAX protease family)